MPAAQAVQAVKEKSMDILYERVAGLDVHKDTIVACVRNVVEGKTKRECLSFATTTEQLAELRAWLEECRCTHVAMEATGVLLDAGVQDPWRGEVRVGRCQCGAHQERARAQDRYERRDVDRRPFGLRADQGKLRSPRRDARAAFADAHPQATGSRADAACAANREDAGGS